MPNTTTGGKRHLQTTCIQECEFHTNGNLCVTPYCIPDAYKSRANSVKYLLAQQMKQRGESERNEFTIIYSPYPSGCAWDNGVLESELDRGKIQPVGPLELEDRDKTWSKLCAVFLQFWVQHDSVFNYQRSGILGISQSHLNIKDHEGWLLLFN